MKLALEWRIVEIHIFGDSQLIINQVNVEYQTKDDKLVPYKWLVDSLKAYFPIVTFQQVPRSKNEASNVMATQASILQMREHEPHFKFLVEELRHPTYNSLDDHIIYTMIGHDSSHYSTIFSHLHDQIVPNNLTRNEKCQLICIASHYTLVSGDFYRKGLEGMLLRCLEMDKSEKTLAKVHNGIYDSHSNNLTLAQKLLRAGYY